jgi:hypothetical protein
LLVYNDFDVAARARRNHRRGREYGGVSVLLASSITSEITYVDGGFKLVAIGFNYRRPGVKNE